MWCFSIDFRTVLTMWCFLFFHFTHLLIVFRTGGVMPTGGVMIRSEVDRGFKWQMGQTKEYKTGILIC
jgi:hypothetical protein